MPEYIIVPLPASGEREKRKRGRANCHPGKKDSAEFRRDIHKLIKAIRQKFAGTNEAKSPKNRLKLTERIEAKSSKGMKN